LSQGHSASGGARILGANLNRLVGDQCRKGRSCLARLQRLELSLGVCLPVLLLFALMVDYWRTIVARQFIRESQNGLVLIICFALLFPTLLLQHLRDLGDLITSSYNLRECKHIIGR